MMRRRGARSLVVDGLPIRWTASARALTAQYEGRHGAVLREELLVPGEAVTPARVARLVRHALARGWGPSARGAVFRVPRESIWDDPRDRGAYRWLRLFNVQLAQLERDLGAQVELAAFWWHGLRECASGGCGARIRFGRCAALPEADHWEGALCFSGNRGERAYADLFAFPFRAGHSLCVDREEAWLFSLTPTSSHAEGRWRSRGWCAWDGPGEWAHAAEPGRVFYTCPPPELRAPAVADGPWAARWEVAGAFDEGARFRWSFLPFGEPTATRPLGTGPWFAWADAAPVRVEPAASGYVLELELTSVLARARSAGVRGGALRFERTESNGEGSSALSAPFELPSAAPTNLASRGR